MVTKRVLKLFDDVLGCHEFTEQCWCPCQFRTAGRPPASVLNATLTLWCFYSFSSASFALPAGTIVSTANVSFQMGFTFRVGQRRESASEAWCLMPARSATSNPSSDKWRHHRNRLSNAYGKDKIQRIAFWLVRILNWAASKYGLSNNTAQTMSIHSFCVVV